MPWRFNPFTGTLDFTEAGGTGGGGAVDSVNGETGDITIEGGGGVTVETTTGTITIKANAYFPAGW
jgi:hypothetical protein